MSDPENTPTPARPPTPTEGARPGAARRILFYLGVCIIIILLFYKEEDWRGERAWEECKLEFTAQGQVLKWDVYMPRRVRPEKNVFKAPNMQKWFVGRTPSELSDLLQSHHPKVEALTIAEVTITPPQTTPAPDPGADITLRCLSPCGAVFPIADESPSNIVDIKFEDVALTFAIQQLAKQVEASIQIDPKVVQSFGGKEPVVSLRFNNATMRQAFRAVLNKYGLQLTYSSPSNGVVTQKEGSSLSTYAGDGVGSAISNLLHTAMGENTGLPWGDLALRRRLDEVKPVRVVLSAERIPAEDEIKTIFADFLPPPDEGTGNSRVQVETTGANSFRVRLTQVCNAQELLAASDAMESQEFATIRTGLKRPLARMDGNYEEPWDLPIPNFVVLRGLSQLLAARAQCQLMLGEPQKALTDLTLIHDLAPIMAGKPVTLLAAMIHVAISGLYVSVVADGLRRQAWGEPELAALQNQLADIKLVPQVSAALQLESAGVCEHFQNLNAYEFAKIINPKTPSRLHPMVLFFITAPQGWLYQNMTTVARLERGAVESMSPKLGRIYPKEMESANEDTLASTGHFSPYTYLARIAIPNFVRAGQTTARNQTQVRQAEVVCALERYRLAQGRYPEKLEGLMPQYLAKIPRDVIGGQPLKYCLNDDDIFLLYSVGWSEKDGGGVAGKPDSKGDWVWGKQL